MNKLSQFIKSIRLKQIVTVFLAGFIFLISTACSGTDSAQAQTNREGFFSQNRVYESKENPDYDAYDANQSKKPEAGFNQYEDDPRADNPNVRAKAEKLIRGAKANVEKADSSREYADEVGKTGEVLGKYAQEDRDKFNRFKEDISKGAEQRLDTTKSNLDKASKDIKRAADDVSDAIEYKAEDTNKTVRRAAEDTIDKIRS
jgi:hypothetical protein